MVNNLLFIDDDAGLIPYLNNIILGLSKSKKFRIYIAENFALAKLQLKITPEETNYCIVDPTLKDRDIPEPAALKSTKEYVNTLIRNNSNIKIIILTNHKIENFEKEFKDNEHICDIIKKNDGDEEKIVSRIIHKFNID